MNNHITGIVTAQAKNNKRTAVLIPHGYAVFDIKDGEIFISDEVIGPLEGSGSQDISNLTTGQTVSVDIIATLVSGKEAVSLLENK